MKRMNVKSTVTFSQIRYEEQNPSFATAVMKIMAVGQVANKTVFPKEAIIQALPTLKNTPLVSLYKVERDDLGGHETSYLIKNGKMKLTYGTDAIGVIPESAQQWFEVFEENGQQVEYLMSEVLIWRRYDASELILKEGQFPISMEIEIKEKWETEDHISLVESFDFLAVAVLGSRNTPAFRSAYLKVFSEETDVINELMSDLNQYLTYEAMGGETMEVNEKQETILSEEVQTEPSEFEKETTEPIEEVKEEVATEEETTPTSDEDETQSEDVTKEEVSDEVAGEEEEKETTQPSQYEALQTQYDTLLVAHGQLQQAFDSLTQQYQEATTTYEQLNQELEDLRLFKAKIDQEARQQAEDELFARFPMLNEMAEFVCLKEQAKDYELIQLEEKLFQLLGKQTFEAQQSTNSAQVVVYERQPQKENVPCAFNILDKYLK